MPPTASSSIKDTEQVVASIDPSTFVDAKGSAVPGATVSGTPTWGIADPSLATVTPSADGLSCTFVGQKAGQTQVNVSGQATNPADGATTDFNAVGTLTVTPGDVAGVSITFGTPTAQS